MMKSTRTLLFLFLWMTTTVGSWAQCSITNATGCVCRTAGQTSCELLPDMTISWQGLSTYLSGPNEYAQDHGTNPGRLRITGSTPNIGRGNLEVRGVNAAGQRAFICGDDTIPVSGSQQNYSCPQGQQPKQVLYQRIYRKNGTQMTFTDNRTGTMTYHPNHGHYHVDDWTTMTLRLEDPNEPLPTKWPIVASGAKIGFCLMDYYACWSGSATGHCRTQQAWNQGTAMNSMGSFPNNGLYRQYNCGADFQGISSGWTDVYDENLEGMWINLMSNLCNGNYWIVAEVDPTNVFREENEDNNWTAMPFSITKQRDAGSGGTGYIDSDKRPVLTPGGTVKLTATPGYSYLWNTGANTRSITVSQPGAYSCTITAPCGSLTTGTITVGSLAAPVLPTTTGASVIGPASATLGSTGSEPVWYTQPSGGAPIATGNSYTTPVLEQSTTYWVADRSRLQATSATAGKSYMGTHGSNFNGRQWLIFNANEPFLLRSVQVYSNAVGLRHFAVVDTVGNLIAEKFVELGTGLQTVQLDFRIPAGAKHRIGAYDSGATSQGTQLVFQDMHRSSTGVSYPYAIGSVGSIIGSTQGPSYYHYLYNWQVEQEAVVAESARVPVLAEVTTGVSVSIKAFLEGPYDANTGLMYDSLRIAGLIPLNEPYAAMGFPLIGVGGETLTAGALAASGSNAIVDWVRVEVRSATAPATVVATQSAVITRSGEVRSVTGTPLRFNIPGDEPYYVALRHRNHLGVMTSAPVQLSGSSPLIDLSSAAVAVFGTDARKAIGSVRVLWSGDCVRDGAVLYTGAGNDRDRILTVIGGTIPTNVVSGYDNADLNLDGRVRYTGSKNDRDLILSNIGGVVPTNSRVQQLP